MARPSSRPRVIDAALAVVGRRGVTALTLDAVAEEAGVTKKGLMYHFPGKHALLLGVHEELAARTDRLLREATGREPGDATLVERTRAYVQVMLETPSDVEMRLILEAALERDWLEPWDELYRRWFPEDARPVEELDEPALRCRVARMAADGSWAHESTSTSPMGRAARQRVTAAILEGLVDAV